MVAFKYVAILPIFPPDEKVGLAKEEEGERKAKDNLRYDSSAV